ncbi:SDR family oxidoreductase [Dyadobacter sp. 676]|uniref:SDR family oxidoreductase n=1 Tax=Dyadobacter sp. 676 TaxID=3088362 RepID=A0AAU8FMF6_9BACT
MENRGKYALITGATSGIGLELAKLFAKDGFNLVITARDIAELDETATLLRAEGVEVLPIAKDLFDREQAFGLYADIKQKDIEIDVLVNNAGQGVYGHFEQIDVDRELRIIDLNIASLVILTKCFLSDMLARNSGRILNLASIASKLPGPWQAVYHGTKAFVLSFTEAIREETKDSGVTITALMPGVTDTDFFNKADMENSRAVQDEDDLADPAVVARDGYEALMAGKDKVISGFKNKMQVAMSAVMPDSVVAHQMSEQQKPVN